MKRILTISLLVVAVALSAVARQRPRVALVLGGGGAKGAAEVGALKVIDSLGIKPDLIVGTSIGSVVGGLYATGWSAERLDTLFSNQEWLNLLTDRREELARVPYREKGGVTYVFGFPLIRKGQYKFGVLAGERLTERLDSMMGHPCPESFDLLPTPYRCVAADLPTATEVVLDSGSVAEAMRASIAIPGVFTPVKRGRLQLVDGGMTNNLPVDVARSLGADVVIAIDLAQQQPRQHDFSLAELFGIGGILDWIVSRPDLKKYTQNCKDADVLIRPQLAGFDVTSFSNISMRRMIRLGEAAAREHSEELKEIRKKVCRK